MSHPLRLSIGSTHSATADLARSLEADAFLRWFGNTPEQLAHEYGPYDQASFFIAVHDRSGAAVGMIRVIRPSAAGLKSLHDCAGEPWRLDVPASVRDAGVRTATTWDLATLCVDDAYRRSLSGSSEVSRALYHALYAVSVAEQVESWVAILDDRVLAALRSLTMPFAALPSAGSRPYLGSAASTPVYANVEETVRRMNALDPGLYRLLVLGQGFRDVDLEPLARHLASL